MQTTQTDPQSRSPDPDLQAILENIRVLDEPMGQIWRRQRLIIGLPGAKEDALASYYWGPRALPLTAAL